MKRFLLSVGLISSLLAFDNIQNNTSYIVEGKVIKAYTQNGYGRMQNQWLFMNIKTSNGVIRQIAIAPTFRISNLPIKEGDIVKINGFTPPMFPIGVIKAWDIYDKTQKKDYPISGYNGYRRF